MKAVATKIFADLRRRRLQTLVVVLILFLASATSTIGLTLLGQSTNPYDRAFEAQKGAHLQVWYDARKVSLDQLRSTPTLIDAASSGGPWPASGFQLEKGSAKYLLNVIGRDDPDGEVEILRLAAGRWVQAPGEVVLTRSFAEHNRVSIGDRLTALGTPDRASLVVVGQAIDIDEGEAELSSQSAWVRAAQLPELAPKDSLGYRMVYRFDRAPSDPEFRALVARIQAALPAGALSASVNYLLFKRVFNITNQFILTFLLAFGVFALLASAGIVANMVTGIVIASYREIGIMKAIGFAPSQVVGILTGQMLLPALLGCALGIPAGTLVSQPLVDRDAHALGLPTQAVYSPLTGLLVLAGVLATVTISATLPGLRAGLLSAVEAISLGTSPQRPRRSHLGRLLQTLRLARPLSLGAADAFRRPLRGSLTAFAVLLGVATLIFAVGLRGSMESFVRSTSLAGTVQVQLTRSQPYPDARVMDLLVAQPETASVTAAVFGNAVAIPGVADPVFAIALRGDSARLGIPVLRGKWFSAPGEVVAPKATLDEAHLAIGDSFTGTIGGEPMPLRIVGEIFSINNLGHSLMFDQATLSTVVPDPQPLLYFVQLRPGSDAAAYAHRVQSTEPDFLSVTVTDMGAPSVVTVINSVMLILALVLAVIGLAGVLNTLLLNTRERARDVAILKGLGMTPRQVLAMVTASAFTLGLVGGILAVPAGIVIHRAMMIQMGRLIGNTIPNAALEVFSPTSLALLALTGIGVAILGALLPARWAARARVVEALHAE